MIYISKDEVYVDFDQPFLGSEEDVENYVISLKTAFLEVVNKKNRIRL